MNYDKKDFPYQLKSTEVNLPTCVNLIYIHKVLGPAQIVTLFELSAKSTFILKGNKTAFSRACHLISKL